MTAKPTRPVRLPAEGEWFCLCGAVCKSGTLCSPRCEFISEKLKTPFGRKMTMKGGIRLFGRMYDKQQQALSQPATEESR